MGDGSAAAATPSRDLIIVSPTIDAINDLVYLELACLSSLRVGRVIGYSTSTVYPSTLVQVDDVAPYLA
mgnify:CR=1 FL=1